MGHDGVLAPFETALGPRWTWHTKTTVLSRLGTDGLRYVGWAQGSAARASMLRRIPINRP